MYRLDDYDFPLPQELIAQVPEQRRDACRLLVLDRRTEKIEHGRFSDLLTHLRKEDLLVVNDTRVVPARLLGKKETGGRVEVLVLDPGKDPREARRSGYRCLIRSSKPARAGARLFLEGRLEATVLEELGEGQVLLRFPCSDLIPVLERLGRVPLPPYIRRKDREREAEDRWDYQTVYASRPGAVAAPTAGLHFSHSFMNRLEERGVRFTRITLHVGYGTFAPVRVRDIREHRVHAEYAEIPTRAVEAIRETRRKGGRVVAVGTTVVRTLEWAAKRYGEVRAVSGLCDLYIYPGHVFRVVDAMITNFHLPKSSLILLVSAFAGRERILRAYREAVNRKYRFFSYGDAMLIL